MCCLWTLVFSLTSLSGDGVIAGEFRLGYVPPVLCYCQMMLLLLPLVLGLKDKVVVVCWSLA